MAVIDKIVFLMALFVFLKAEKYTTKWDNIDVDEILTSDRLLGNYVKCLLDQGHCTPDGMELKKNIPDALQNECMKCSEKQKENTEKVINFLIENKKDWWEDLQKKYDPNGIYVQRREMKKKNKETEKEKKAGEEEEEEEKAESGEHESNKGGRTSLYNRRTLNK